MTQNTDVYLNFINGQWRQGSVPEWDENRNPAKPAEVLGRSTRSTAADVAKAIELARVAQKAWAAKTRPARAAVLSKVASIMRSRLESFAKAITLEEGKNLTESRAEVQRSIQLLELVAADGRATTGALIASENPTMTIQTVRVPLGVVGVITPWSSPLAVPVAKLAPALLEGNAVVFKPSTLTPATAKLLVFTFEEAGIPAGVLNLVYGPGAIVGTSIIDDPRVAAISFTGSNEVGCEVNVRAARRFARLQLDLGAKNAMIVCADADLDLAVADAVRSAFGSTGQSSLAISRVVVDRQVHKEFVEKLVAAVKQLKLNDGMLDASAMGPIIDERQYKTVLKAIETARSEGAVLACGGEPATAPGGGKFVTPAVFDEVRPEMTLAKEEVFGPVLAILPVDSLEKAIEVANSVNFGLIASVYTRSIQQVSGYAERLRVGTVQLNTTNTEARVRGAEFFCENKTVYIDHK